MQLSNRNFGFAINHTNSVKPEKLMVNFKIYLDIDIDFLIDEQFALIER